MAFNVTKISLFLILFVIFWDGTTAQSDCTSTVMKLSPCLNYVTGNSSTPSASCCSVLSSVVQSQPKCLCSLMDGSTSSYGISINKTLALALPSACNVQTPPVSRCNEAVNGPTASPATPETPGTKSSGPNIPSGTGSKTVPSTDGGQIGGSNIKAPSNLLGFLLFIASCALSVT